MNFWIYVISYATSLVGSDMQAIIVPIYILSFTGSGLAMSKAAVIFMVIKLVGNPLGGILADKFNRKYIMIISDLCSFTTLALFILYAEMSVDNIIIMQGVISFISVIFRGSSSAIFTELKFKRSIDKARSIYCAVGDSVFIVSPIIGMALYGFMDIKYIFILNSATFFLSACLEMMLVYEPEEKSSENRKSLESGVFKAYLPVVDYLSKRKDVLGVVTFDLLVSFIFVPVTVIFMPHFILNILKIEKMYIGYSESIFGIGLFLGSAFLVKYVDKYNFRSRICLLSNIQFGTFIFMFTAYMFMPLKVYLILAGISMAISGSMGSLSSTPIVSHLHSIVDNDIKGRFFSLFSMSAQVFISIGYLIIGLMVDRVKNSGMIIAIVFALYIIVTFWYFNKTRLGKEYIVSSGS